MSVTAQENAPQPARAGTRPGVVAAGLAVLRRFGLLTLAGLVLAGMVHIVTILLVPVFAERDAGSAYAGLGANGRAELVTPPPSGLPGMLESDPASVGAACAYDLAAGPVRVVAQAGSQPLALTLHRRGGGVIYAITDRAAIRGMLEFVVMTQEQLDARLARDEEGETSRELRIVSDTQQGLIVVRVLAGHGFDRGEAEELATGVTCGIEE